MKKWVRRLIDVVIVASLFVGLFYSVGLSEILEAAKAIELWYLIPYTLIFLVTKFISALNLQIVSAAVRKKIPYWRMFKYYMLTTAIGRFFPGKTGELSLTYLLHKHEKYEYGQGLAVHLIDKVTTLILFSILAVYGALEVFALPLEYVAIILGTLFFIFASLALFWSQQVRAFINKYVIRRFGKYFRGFTQTFTETVRHRTPYLLLNTGVTIVQVWLSFYGAILLFAAFGGQVGLVEVAVITAIVMMIQFLPLPYSGLGVKEIAGVYLFSLVGVPLSITVNFMIFAALFKYVFYFCTYLVYKNVL